MVRIYGGRSRKGPGTQFLSAFAYYVWRMEENHNEPRVRSVSIDVGADTSDLRPDGQTAQLPPPERRRWLPLALSGIAIVVLGVAVFSLGAIEDADTPDPVAGTFVNEPEPDEVTELPLTLEEAVPPLNGRLTVVAKDGDSLKTLIWDPTFRVPKITEISGLDSITWISASFDSADRFVSAAAVTQNEDNEEQEQDLERSGTESGVWIGPPTDIGALPYLTGVISGTWHTSNVDQFAYLKPGAAGIDLWTVTITPPSGRPEEPMLVGTFPEGSDLLIWDKEGFLLRINGSTTALDGDGNVLWSATGITAAATSLRVLQVEGELDDLIWRLYDRVSGREMPTDGLGTDQRSGLPDVVAARNRDLLAVAVQRVDGTTVTITGADTNAPRILHLDGMYSAVQFTSDTTLLVMAERGSSNLLFVDWRTGAQHAFALPLGYRALAVATG